MSRPLPSAASSAAPAADDPETAAAPDTVTADRRASGGEATGVAAPAADAPHPEASATEAPDFEAPGVEAPDFETPDFAAPNCETFSVETPGVETAPAVWTADDRHWMQHALDLARVAEAAGEVPVGAVLVRDGRVLGAAGNGPIGAHDATAHAEIRALRAAGRAAGNYRLPGSTLYVTLEPCPMCAGALVHARIERVVYAAPDPRTGAAGSVYDLLRDPRLNHRCTVESGLCADASAELLRRFFRARRKPAAAPADPA